MNLFEYTFFQNALIGILIISIAAGIIGTYITTRRLVSISGGITHACFGGLGLGYYLGISPIIMAGVFAVVASFGVEWLAQRHRVREDSAIAVVWALGMAIGVLFIFLTPGYVPELNSFLFGNILTISTADIIAFGVYTVVLAALFAVYGRQIVMIAFDRDFARIAGLPVKSISTIMTVMIALAIVLTIRMVGIMLLLSMLSLPPMIAEIFSSRFNRIMALATVISAVTCVTGIITSACIDVPCSAVIVILQVIAYALSRVSAAIILRYNKRRLTDV